MSKKILVVDDDRVNLNMVQSRLEENGFTVTTASDGDEGLTAVGEFKPDLIILDIQMPKTNGYTFMVELRKMDEFQDTSVFILTSHSEMKPIFTLKGVKEYIVKPVNFDDLFKKIEAHLGTN